MDQDLRSTLIIVAVIFTILIGYGLVAVTN
ncbi:YnhF family membrane protein [Vibrio sp. FNV 38]|nr:YnhF family membrane protein [Vibrio sp. FNV 38]